MGTLAMYNILGMAARFKVPILQASTSEIYGNPLVHPQTENYWGNVNPIGPRACYDEGKRVAESLCIAYRDHSGVQVRIARIFNTYGPFMSPSDGRVVSNFMVQALKSDDLTIYGDGKQTRSFCYVDDTVQGLISLLNSHYTLPVNIGNPDEKKIIDLAEIIINVASSKSKLKFIDLPIDDPLKRRPDISLAYETLGWKPSVKLEEGLEKTLEWFKSLQSNKINNTDRIF